jgi:hypothetical protein
LTFPSANLGTGTIVANQEPYPVSGYGWIHTGGIHLEAGQVIGILIHSQIQINDLIIRHFNFEEMKKYFKNCIFLPF